MIDPVLLSILNSKRVVIAAAKMTDTRVNTLTPRASILQNMGLNFQFISAPDQHLVKKKHEIFCGERKEFDCIESVLRLAVMKANQVRDLTNKDSRVPDIIIGMDTRVIYHTDMNTIELCKRPPKDANIKRDMLTKFMLSQIPVEVINGFVIYYGNQVSVGLEKTAIKWKRPDDMSIMNQFQDDDQELLAKGGGFADGNGMAKEYIINESVHDHNSIRGMPLDLMMEKLQKLLLS